MLTMFTIPWPTDKAENLIHRQNNCLDSWALLEPTPEIILCGDEYGVRELAAERGLVHAPYIEYEVDAPVIPVVFEEAEEIATNATIMYCNCDDILMQCLMDAIEIVAGQFDCFMMIGQKWDVEINERLDFSEGWQDRLKERVTLEGNLHGGSAVDYFIYNLEHPVGIDFPRFVIGGTGWDTWLVDDTLRRGFAVVDVTEAVMCVHQHKRGVRPGPNRNHNRELINRRLAEQRRERSDMVGKVNHATWELTADGELREVPDKWRGIARKNRNEPKVKVDGWNKPLKVDKRTVNKRKNGNGSHSLNVIEARGD